VIGSHRGLVKRPEIDASSCEERIGHQTWFICTESMNFFSRSPLRTTMKAMRSSCGRVLEVLQMSLPAGLVLTRTDRSLQLFQSESLRNRRRDMAKIRSFSSRCRQVLLQPRNWKNCLLLNICRLSRPSWGFSWLVHFPSQPAVLAGIGCSHLSPSCDMRIGAKYDIKQLFTLF
jgi:hypothetical protein